jgi:hypothetical protein
MLVEEPMREEDRLVVAALVAIVIFSAASYGVFWFLY